MASLAETDAAGNPSTTSEPAPINTSETSSSASRPQPDLHADFPVLGSGPQPRAAAALRPFAASYTSAAATAAALAPTVSSSASVSVSHAPRAPSAASTTVAASRPTSSSSAAGHVSGTSTASNGLSPAGGIAIVKSILSGDTIVVRGRPVNGPPAELIVTLAGISAPRLRTALRTTSSSGTSASTTTASDSFAVQEPLALDARDFLRTRLIGKEVKYVSDALSSSSTTSSGTPRSFCYVFLREPIDGYTCVNKLMLSAGFARLRRVDQTLAAVTEALSQRRNNLPLLVDDVIADLTPDSFADAEAVARDSLKGLWLLESAPPAKLAPNTTVTAVTRRDGSTQFVTALPLEELSGESLRQLLATHKGKALHAIIEQVRDGASYRVIIPSSTPNKIASLSGVVLLSGIKCPSTGGYPSGTPAEPYAEQAKFYVESKFLQRDIQVIPEAIINDTLIASVKLGPINVALAILSEGYGSVQEWGLAAVTEDPELYRKAENIARDRSKGIWSPSSTATTTTTTATNVVSTSTPGSGPGSEYEATIVRFISADSLIVMPIGSNDEIRISLASVRSPRPSSGNTPSESGGKGAGASGDGVKEYGLDYAAKDYLRSRYIGKHCRVKVDYIQPANQGYEARSCCTVYCEDKNIAEVGIMKGYLDLIRHRKDDNNRSREYLSLSTAFEAAKGRKKGIHSTKPFGSRRVVDASIKAAKAKQYLPFLQRAGKVSGVVDYVVSGSRFRVFVPSQNCIITLALAGVRSPRTSDEFGKEAISLSRRRYMQRDVEIEVMGTDMSGGFLGTLTNSESGDAAECLVRAGLAYVQERGLSQNRIHELKTIEANVVDKKVLPPPPKEEPVSANRNGFDDEYSDEDDY